MIKLFFLIALLNSELPTDSIGVETINGQTFVIHKVDEKETLFGISRRYRTTVDAILQYNALPGSGLEIGQILKVPYTAKPLSRPTNGMVHTVAPRETLYSISRAYQVSVEDIRRWNNLTDANLAIGQELIIKKPAAVAVRAPQPAAVERPEPMVRKGVHTVEPGQTLFSISRTYHVSVEQLREWNHLEGNELKVGQTLFVSAPERGAVSTGDVSVAAEKTPAPREEPQAEKNAPVKDVPVRAVPAEKTAPPASSPEARGQSAESIRISESLKNGDEIIEGGLAELIEGTDGNRKYLALHRTAPMGTILKVRNEMNNREVFVRVMGKLPDTALTDKLIIKISKSAYDRLGAIDPRFRVEVTYYK